MKKLTLIGVLAVLCLTIQGQPSVLKRLNIGDTLPEELWSMRMESLNEQQKEGDFKMADYRGKVIVLDFWATWCAPCVKGLPKLTAFQQSYKKDVKIIPVSHEKKEKVKNFFEKRPALKLPSITNDTALVKYFPHRQLPHCVIIDKNGIVTAITTSEELTAQNLEKVIKNGPVSLQLKTDQVNFKSQNPLIINGNGGSSKKVLYYSLLTGYLEGIGGITSYTKKDDSIIGFKLTNQPVPVLYLHAFGKPEYYWKSRVLFEDIGDGSKYFDEMKKPVYSLEWDQVYTYCFELIAPGYSDPERRRIMVSELNNAFGGLLGIKGSIGQRQTNCLVITRHDKTRPLKTDGRYAKGSITSNRVKKVSNYKNIQVGHLLPFLEDITGLPVIDETHFTGYFDMEVSHDVRSVYKNTKDLKLLQKLLNNYGFKIEPALRETEMLVISTIK